MLYVGLIGAGSWTCVILNNLVILVIMSGNCKYHGDSGSVGEELMVNVSELEETGFVVEKAVREGYFTLPDALSAYRMTEIEYVAYLLLKNKGKFEVADKEKQIVGAIFYLVEAFHAPSASFDALGKEVMKELETIVHSSPLRDSDLFVA
jgi:hypothetical protein